MNFDPNLYLQGYLAVTLPILWIIFTCGINTTHEGTMCHVPFRGQGHTGFSHFAVRLGIS